MSKKTTKLLNPLLNFDILSKETALQLSKRCPIPVENRLVLENGRVMPGFEVKNSQFIFSSTDLNLVIDRYSEKHLTRLVDDLWYEILKPNYEYGKDYTLVTLISPITPLTAEMIGRVTIEYDKIASTILHYYHAFEDEEYFRVSLRLHLIGGKK